MSVSKLPGADPRSVRQIVDAKLHELLGEMTAADNEKPVKKKEKPVKVGVKNVVVGTPEPPTEEELNPFLILPKPKKNIKVDTEIIFSQGSVLRCCNTREMSQKHLKANGDYVIVEVDVRDDCILEENMAQFLLGMIKNAEIASDKKRVAIMNPIRDYVGAYEQELAMVNKRLLPTRDRGKRQVNYLKTKVQDYIKALCCTSRKVAELNNGNFDVEHEVRLSNGNLMASFIVLSVVDLRRRHYGSCEAELGLQNYNLEVKANKGKGTNAWEMVKRKKVGLLWVIGGSKQKNDATTLKVKQSYKRVLAEMSTSKIWSKIEVCVLLIGLCPPMDKDIEMNMHEFQKCLSRVRNCREIEMRGEIGIILNTRCAELGLYSFELSNYFLIRSFRVPPDKLIPLYLIKTCGEESMNGGWEVCDFSEEPGVVVCLPYLVKAENIQFFAILNLGEITNRKLDWGCSAQELECYECLVKVGSIRRSLNESQDCTWTNQRKGYIRGGFMQCEPKENLMAGWASLNSLQILLTVRKGYMSTLFAYVLLGHLEEVLSLFLQRTWNPGITIIQVLFADGKVWGFQDEDGTSRASDKGTLLQNFLSSPYNLFSILDPLLVNYKCRKRQGVAAKAHSGGILVKKIVSCRQEGKMVESLEHAMIIKIYEQTGSMTGESKNWDVTEVFGPFKLILVITGWWKGYSWEESDCLCYGLLARELHEVHLEGLIAEEGKSKGLEAAATFGSRQPATWCLVGSNASGKNIVLCIIIELQHKSLNPGDQHIPSKLEVKLYLRRVVCQEIGYYTGAGLSFDLTKACGVVLISDSHQQEPYGEHVTSSSTEYRAGVVPSEPGGAEVPRTEARWSWFCLIGAEDGYGAPARRGYGLDPATPIRVRLSYIYVAKAD